MSDQAREETLQAILSILDSIRPDAAEALRRRIANGKHVDVLQTLESGAIAGAFAWDETEEGRVFWAGVNREYRDYYEKWFK